MLPKALRVKWIGVHSNGAVGAWLAFWMAHKNYRVTVDCFPAVIITPNGLCRHIVSGFCQTSFSLLRSNCTQSTDSATIVNYYLQIFVFVQIRFASARIRSDNLLLNADG